MKKILILGLLIGLSGCGESKEQARYNDLQKKLEKLQIDLKPINSECNKYIQLYENEYKNGDAIKAMDYAKQSVPSCEKAKELNMEVIKLNEEAILLVPYLKDSDKSH